MAISYDVELDLLEAHRSLDARWEFAFHHYFMFLALCSIDREPESALGYVMDKGPKKKLIH